MNLMPLYLIENEEYSYYLDLKSNSISDEFIFAKDGKEAYNPT